MISDDPGMTRRAFIGTAASGAALATAGASPALALQMPRFPELPQSWGRAPTIPLWPEGTPGGGFVAQPVPANSPSIFIQNVAQPRLHVFTPARPNGRALLVMPGGSYTFVSVYNEGLQIAEHMTAAGYTVFVLVYRLPGEGWEKRADVPLQDAQRAMRLIRSQAARYRIAPDQIYAVGFSAGGHLAATLATAADEPAYAAKDAADALPARPRACGLIYPVISHQSGVGHADSTRHLLGDAPDAAAIAHRSPAEHVDAQTPPLFLVHALDDTAVPPENSLLMLDAMRRARRPVAAHLFESGGHGFGPGRPGTPAARWLTLFEDWVQQHA